LLGLLSEELSNHDAVYYLPQQIYQLAQSNAKGKLSLEKFNSILRTDKKQLDPLSGTFVSYQCYDLGELVSKLNNKKTTQSPYFVSDDGHACNVWGRGFALKVFEKVDYKPVPTMVLTGEYDTLVPSQLSREVAKSLPNAKLFQFKGVGHDVIGSLRCALYMAAAFFDRPDHKPEDACMMALKPPSFYVPEKEQVTQVAKTVNKRASS